MATYNIEIPPNVWTKVADASNVVSTVAWRGGASVEFATTTPDAAPAVHGFMLNAGDVMSRQFIGGGHLWARCREKVMLVVAK